MGSFNSSVHSKLEARYPVDHPEIETADMRLARFMHLHGQFCAASIASSKPTLSSRQLFTLFPQLPPELRIRIWEIVANQPRIVELSCTPATSQHTQGRWFSHSKPPTLFQVTSESRKIGLQHYSVLEFSPGQLGVLPVQFYINFVSDILCLCADIPIEWVRNLLERNEQLKEHLRHLMLKEGLWRRLDQSSGEPPHMPAILSKWQRAPRITDGLKALDTVKFHGS